MFLAWSIYTFPVLYTHNKMFIFLTNDKPVIKSMRYGIILLVLIFLISYVLIFLWLLNKFKIIFLILINLKLIQLLKNSIHCKRSYAKIYLIYICPILKTSVAALIMIHQYMHKFGRYNVLFNTTTNCSK